MRAYSTNFIAAAFVLFVSAVTADKLPISATVQTCVDSMVSTGLQLDAVTAAVASFTSAGGYPKAIAIYYVAEELGNRVKKSIDDCCVESPTITPEEAKAISDTVASFVPKTKNSLTQLQNKKSEFDKISISNSIKSEIDNLDAQTKSLGACLVKKIPLDTTEVDAAFLAAKTAYGTV